MKKKQVLSVILAAAMAIGMTACGSSAATSDSSAADNSSTEATSETADASASTDGVKSYADIVLGEDFTDLTATISFFNCRTDLDTEDYGGTTWAEYLEEFNKMYPNITVEETSDTNYADDALTHLQSGDYETVMWIPAVDKADLDSYFMSYGDLDTMKKEINYATAWKYGDQVYGIPCDATTNGIVYNKKVFEEAGVTETPKTPEEFQAALQAIKDNTDAIPLYTNYAAGWTMGAWDAYVGTACTGDNTYLNQKFIHEKDPFRDYGDGTHANAVYKILYDAAANGLIEDDYSTTDWEGSKTMINNGEIGCMVLGSWAYPQMEAAGDNGDDIGYMAFPISVDGKQYGYAAADYSYAINTNATDDEKQAALVFVKWMTEKSGYSYNEDGLPVDAESTDTKLNMDGVTLLEDEPAIDGEEDILNTLNSESELNINAGGNDKIQLLIEHAVNGDESFDDIMAEWNQKWTDAQEASGVEVTE